MCGSDGTFPGGETAAPGHQHPEEVMRRVVENLDGEYGPKHNTPNGKPIDTAVAIILSQQNSAVSGKACFDELKRRFPTWNDVRRAPVDAIEDAIRTGGLARLKAKRIHALLEALAERHGAVEIGELPDRQPESAIAELVRLPGVGPKTARCILLFAVGADVFPMDVHIFRIAERIGLLAPKTPDERAHRIVGALIPEGRAYSAHVNMIAHGRTVCRPAAPRCDACCIAEYCEFAQRRLDAMDRRQSDPRFA